MFEGGMNHFLPYTVMCKIKPNEFVVSILAPRVSLLQEDIGLLLHSSRVSNRTRTRKWNKLIITDDSWLYCLVGTFCNDEAIDIYAAESS